VARTGERRVNQDRMLKIISATFAWGFGFLVALLFVAAFVVISHFVVKFW
jgi:hypothetical protein